MATRKRAAATKSTDKFQYITVKDSCGNVGDIQESFDDALDVAKTDDTYGVGSYGHYGDDDGDFVTIFRLVPVARVKREASFTVENLEKVA